MKASVLVVDDDLSMVEVIVETLERSHYCYRTAENGAKALDVLQEHPIDLVISDVMMPQMTGLELMNHARETFPDMPFILISGYITGEEAFDAGADDFIKKPFKLREIEDSVKRILETRGKQQC